MITNAPIAWQDLPRRSAWIKAAGWLCEKTQGVLKATEWGPFGLWGVTLAFALAMGVCIGDFFSMPIAVSVWVAGLIWAPSILVFAFLRHIIDRRCQTFLQSREYQQEIFLLEGMGYYEVDYWLGQRPDLLDTVAQWALANGDALQMRHLWALQAQGGRGPDYDFTTVMTKKILNHTQWVAPEFSLRDVRDGELQSAMNFLELNQGKTYPVEPATNSTPAVRRL